MPNETSETVYSSYTKLHTAWRNDVSSSDIYHMILAWIEVWNPEIVHPEVKDLLQDFIQRCHAGDSTYDLVEDFIYRSPYDFLREIFMRE